MLLPAVCCLHLLPNIDGDKKTKKKPVAEKEETGQS